MNDNSTYYDAEMLNRYLDKELSPAEEAAITGQLQHNASLQSTLNNLLIARQAIQAQGLKEKVARLHRQYRPAAAAENAAKVIPLKPAKPLRALLRVAAAAVVLMMGYSAYFYFSNTSGSVYDRYYTSYQLPVNRAAENRAAGADSLFIAGNYNALISNWQQPGEKNRQQVFLTAMAFLETNRPAEAIPLLRELQLRNSREPEPVFEDESDYYLAMAMIKTGDITGARTMLNKMKDNPLHLYHRKAKQISSLRLRVLDMKH